MKGAESPDQVGAVDAHDPSGGETSAKRRERGGVATGIVGRDEHDAVRDVEVGVARGETLAVVLERAGHRERLDPQGLAVLVPHLPEPREIVTERSVVGVGGILLDDGDHGPRIRESGEVIHMTVGIVTDDAVAEPEDVGDAEIVPEARLDLAPGEAGIPVGVQQTGLGGEQRAGAVHVDGPAFHDDAGMEDRHPELVGDPRRNDVIEVIRRVLAAPGVEAPVDDRLFHPAVARAVDEDRPVVTAPGVVRGVMVEEDVDRRDAFRAEELAHPGFEVRIGDVDVHFLVRHELAYHRREDAGYRLELVGPRRLLVGPAEPGAAVRGPLGGHAVTQAGGGSHVWGGAG